MYLASVFFYDFASIRQNMADGILFIACIYAFKKEKYKFLLLWLLASTIHNSALVGIIIYPLQYFNRKLLCCGLIIAFGISVMGGIGHLIATLISFLGNASNLVRINTINNYINQNYELDSYTFMGFQYISWCILSTAMLLYYNNLIKIIPLCKIWIPMYIFGIAWMFAFIDVGILGSRIGGLFTGLPVCMILPTFIKIFKKKNEKNIIYLIEILYCAIYFTVDMKNRASVNLFDYHSIMQFLM
jgi:transmembrane protein EpsG